MSESTSTGRLVFDSGRWLYSKKLLVQTVAILGFFMLWEAIGRLTSSLFLAPPSDALVSAADLLREPAFLSDLQIGLVSLIVGVLLGIIVGFVTGISMGSFDPIENFLDPYVTILYSLPIVALIPFIVLILGSGFAPRVFIIFLFAFLPMSISVLEGTKETPEDLTEVGTSFGASRLDNIRYVFLPSMIPYIITGSRLAVGRGLRGWVLAELFFLIGVGGRLLEFGNQFQTASVFAILFIFTVIGMGSTQLVYVVSGYLAPWYDPSMEGPQT
jgi:ABC-type nitrate/sulfonate/bicarbonate transport system permease component